MWEVPLVWRHERVNRTRIITLTAPAQRAADTLFHTSNTGEGVDGKVCIVSYIYIHIKGRQWQNIRSRPLSSTHRCSDVVVVLAAVVAMLMGTTLHETGKTTR